MRDNDPYGGFLDFYATMPDMADERITIQEVRRGNMDDTVWAQISSGAIKPDPVINLDAVLQPYFDAATVIWTREGGNV